MPELSVILCTYNPDIERLTRTLNGLREQSLPVDRWELILIDNNSWEPFDNQIDISWHPQAKLVTEQKQGLTNARLKGFTESSADIIVMVDDDNILQESYLRIAMDTLNAQPKLGAIGGKSLPIFEAVIPHWLNDFYGNLALRDLGDETVVAKWENNYPNCAPIGAGMCIRRMALQTYLNKAKSGQLLAGDRTGQSLTSGGDNEIVLEILTSGWQVGYFPQLILQHIIPPARLQVKYLARLNRETNRSWVQLLQDYGINPWKKIKPSTLLFRKFKAYFTSSAWKGSANYIKWQAACGIFEGLTDIQ
jgi:glycosyltransferase involved in cell wall biosynthesis